MEKWRDVKGYEGLYQVSNLGHVKSLPRKVVYKRGDYNVVRQYPGITLKATPLQNGYLVVSLTKNGYRKSCLLHRVVAQAFLENPKEYAEVNHIDFDKTNNTLDNLEWVSRQENIDHYLASSSNRGENNPSSKLTQEDVLAIRKLSGKQSQRKIAAQFGISQLNVSKIVNHRTWTHI